MPPAQEQPNHFPLTRWSLVLSSSEGDVAAIEEICRLYWPPLYCFSRRSGLCVEDAEDVTQRFFMDMVKDGAALLANATQGAGHLRSLFLRVLKRRIADHFRTTQRVKRGGGQSPVPLDTATADATLSILDPSLTPEEVFDRQWALNLLQLALARQEMEYSAAGRSSHFAALVPFLGIAESEPDYAAAQQTLGMSAAGARQTVRRFCERFRRHLRAEIADTIKEPSEAAVDMELAELRAALGR